MERALDQRLLAPAMRGEPVALSLDTRVQAAMESELGAAVSKFKALAGAGIVLDVNTGEVLAMVSLPDFNPNNIADATEDELRNNVRSEEHTSELQSLMSISYAVICLKKKKSTHNKNNKH